jgi:TRAP-type C4-dicarboxylate transport system permease small subunit
MQRMFGFCESVLTYLAVFSIFFMMLLTTGDAAGRYLLNLPITGAFEFTTNYVIVASVYFGMTCVYRGGGFIRVTFLVDHLPKKIKLMVEHLVQVVSMLYCAALVYCTLIYALRGMAASTKLSSIPIPLAPAYFLVPAGLLLVPLLMLVDLVKVRKGGSPLFRENSPTA